MESLERLFRQPEHLHVVLNHFPLVGLLVAGVALVAALALRHRPAIRVGLGLVGLLAISFGPVAHYGEQGYDRVLSMADDPGQGYLRYHAELADRWAFLYYLTAGVAVVGLSLSWKWPRALTPVSAGVLLLTAASLLAGARIAQVGGEIRHREFRNGPPPPAPAHSALSSKIVGPSVASRMLSRTSLAVMGAKS